MIVSKTKSNINSNIEQLLSAGFVLITLYCVGISSNKFTNLNQLSNPETSKASSEFKPNKSVYKPIDERSLVESYSKVAEDYLALRETPSSDYDIREWYQKRANALQSVLESKSAELTQEQTAKIKSTIAYYRELEYLNCGQCSLNDKQKQP